MTATIAQVVQIPLIGGGVATIDAADHKKVQGLRWRQLQGHRGKVYAYTHIGQTPVYMHRLIAETPAGMETDHINGDGLDNRRANLRAATPSQNRANMGKPRRPDGRPSSSIYKGVSWDRSRKKWQAKIQVNGRTFALGRFVREKDAARAYDSAALAQWGEFAQLNFPAVAT